MPAVAGSLFIVLPLAAMLTRVDWADFPQLISSPGARTALLLSLKTSSIATGLCLLLGVPMAIVLARITFRGQDVIRSLVLLPLVLPPVVAGIALLYTFGRRGLLGQTFEAFGIQIAFSTTAVIMAQTFVAMPFLVVSLEGALRSMGQRYEAVAATLGARPTTVLRRVTLPMVLPAVASGAVLSFARALGEFGATITFVSNIPGETQTLPLAIYGLTQSPGGDAAIPRLCAISVAVSIAALTGSEWINRRARLARKAEAG